MMAMNPYSSWSRTEVSGTTVHSFLLRSTTLTTLVSSAFNSFFGKAFSFEVHVDLIWGFRLIQMSFFLCNWCDLLSGVISPSGGDCAVQSYPVAGSVDALTSCVYMHDILQVSLCFVMMFYLFSSLTRI